MAGPPRRSERWVVFGASESGKSYWTKRQVDRIPASDLVLVWDPTGEWTGPRADKGIARARAFPGMLELIGWVLQHNPTGAGKRLVVQSARPKDFAAFCRFAYLTGDCWVVIDEAHHWCRADRIPRDMVYLSQVSRHRRCNLVLIAQRPTGLSPDLRDNKARTVLFRMPGEASLAWVRNEFGKETEERVRKCPPRSYVEPQPESDKLSTSKRSAEKAKRR